MKKIWDCRGLALKGLRFQKEGDGFQRGKVVERENWEELKKG